MSLTAANVYAEELSSRGHGFPLWYPEGRKNSAAPRIGDMGYLEGGKFISFFNVTEQATSDHFSSLTKGPPDGYVPLEYDRDLYDNSTEDALQTKFINSGSVTRCKVSANAQATGGIADGSLSYGYECTKEKGALLLTKDNAHGEAVGRNDRFPSYMKDNYSLWVKWLAEEGIIMKPEQLILVRGTMKTTEWTVAAFWSRSSGHSIDIQGTFVTAGSVGFELQYETKIGVSVEHRSGPKAISGDLVPIPPTTPMDRQYDQCVFLAHYRLKRRLGLFRTVEAAAGYDELPRPDQDDDAVHLVVEMDTHNDNRHGDDANVPMEFANDAVDIVLDYILARSNATIAVACEEDINDLVMCETGSAEWPEDMIAWLQGIQPTVNVEDGMGTLSLVEAVQKGRRAELRRMMKSLDTAAAGGDHPEEDNREQEDDERPPGRSSPRHVKNIIGEGRLLRGKYLPEIEIIPWPHMALSEQDGESYAISSMALSPDGQFLATGSDDSIVRLWSLRNGRLIREWRGHEDSVWSVSYSPDGRRVASGSSDLKIMLWDPEQDEAGDVLGDHGESDNHDMEISLVCYSPDGRRLASGSVDTTVKIWDPETKTLLHTLTEHDSEIMQLAFAGDGARLISCAGARGCVWNVESGDLIAQLEGHTDNIWSMAPSHRGDRVITGSEDHSARIWDIATGEELVTVNEHTGPVWAVSFSPDDSEVVSGSYDSTLVTNDSLSGQCRTVFTERASVVDSVGYSHNGKYIVSGSADGRVKLWDRERGRLIAEYQGHEDKIKDMVFTGDSRNLLTCSEDGSVRMWSVLDAVRID